MIDHDAYLVSQYGPDLDGEAACQCQEGSDQHMAEDKCRCQIVGWSRDPYEPHIPAQPEWEQADDCPVHPRGGQ